MRTAIVNPSIRDSVTRLNIVSCCLVASAFGPYLLQHLGLRLDHVVIYSAFSYLVLTANISISSVSPNVTLLAIMLTFGATVLWTGVVTIFGGYPKLTWPATLASMENFLQPAALAGIMALATVNVPRSELSKCMRNVALAICLFLSLNAVLAICQLFWDTWPLIQFFLRPLEGHTVWQDAVLQGRYSGIFDQPLENGFAYSIGLIGWIYYINRSNSIWGWVMLPLLIIGGILAASKVFLLAGVPAAILYFLASRESRPATYLQAFVGLVGTGIVVDAVLDQWTGVSFFRDLVDPSNIAGDPLGVYTAGRFGNEGWIWTQFETVWKLDLLSGFGFGTAPTLDNAYLEFFWQGGIVALLLYFVVILCILWSGIQGLLVDREHGLLILIFGILIVGIGLGGPVLTMNRSSILLWVFICPAIAIVTRPKPGDLYIGRTFS